jgi:hypothetical protein
VLYADGFLALLLVVVWVYAIFDVITTDAGAVRNLPKLAWLLIVIVFGELLIGPVLWLVAGRPGGPARSLPYKGNNGIPPEYDRPGRTAAQNPDDDAEFLHSLRARAEEQRKKAAEQARKLRDADDEPPPPSP